MGKEILEALPSDGRKLTDKYMRNFNNPTDIKGVNGPQHGSFMRLTKKEYKKLEKWGKSSENMLI